MRWDERVRNRRVYSDLRNPSKMCAMLCAIFDLKGASHWTSTTTQARACRRPAVGGRARRTRRGTSVEQDQYRISGHGPQSASEGDRTIDHDGRERHSQVPANVSPLSSPTTAAARHRTKDKGQGDVREGLPELATPDQFKRLERKRGYRRVASQDARREERPRVDIGRRSYGEHGHRRGARAGTRARRSPRAYPMETSHRLAGPTIPDTQYRPAAPSAPPRKTNKTCKLRLMGRVRLPGAAAPRATACHVGHPPPRR